MQPFRTTQTLGDICDRVNGIIRTGPFGSQLHESDYKTDGLPVIMPKNIVDGKIDIQNIARIGPDDENRLKSHKVKIGDIIYGRRGDIGRRALIRITEEGWLCGTGCLRISLGEKLIDPMYLYYYLGWEPVVCWMKGRAIGATMPNLNTNILRELPITFPSLPAQHKIAWILYAYDNLIENNTRRIHILEEMAQLIYREWFVHFRYPGHENVRLVESQFGLFPEGWEAKKLGKLIEFKKGKKNTTFNLENDSGGVPLLLIENLRSGEYGYTTDENTVIAETNDVIMVMDGASSGMCFIGNYGAIGSTLGRYRPISQLMLFPNHLFYFLKSYFNQISDNNIGSAIPHANKDYINQLDILLPSRELKEKFESIIEPITQGIINLRKRCVVVA